MKEYKYDVSILILTYNPSWDKLKTTVISALLQKKINYEIIVSDDGSENNYFDELKNLFLAYKFNDYKIVGSDKNEGTVKNLNKALLVAEGVYIRDISPGDYLFSEISLANWLCYVKQRKIDVCFGLPIFYNDDKELKIIKHITTPKLISMYKKRNEESLRREYLLMEDGAVGAAYLTKKDILLKYNNMMINKVKLGEDFAYALMIFDHIPIYMYDEPVVWYEFGNGVSTCNKPKFNKIIDDDRDATRNIMLEMNGRNKFDAKYKKYISTYNKISDKKFLLKLIWLVLFPKMYLWRIRMIFHKEYTDTDVDLSFFDYIRNI